MKTRINKFVIPLFIALFTTTLTFSQSIIQGDPSQEIEEFAKERTEEWKLELGLTEKQELLVEQKITEFAMRREELLQSKMNEEAKKERLLSLQVEESQDMRDILTKPQFERYLAVQQLRLEKENNNKTPE